MTPRALTKSLLTGFSMIAMLAACGPGQTQDTQKYSGSGFNQETTPTQPRRVPSSQQEVKASFGPVVRTVAPAVVNVYAESVSRQRVDPFWEMFGAVPRARTEKSLGSGVIVRKDGIIVTNNHVVEGATSLMVVLSDRREYPAKLLLADPRTDLAVLKLEAGANETFATLEMDDDRDQQVGDLVLAIGNPFGVGQTVTSGIISALDRTQVGSGEGAYIQTDAAINPGNSGGALVDMNGRLIGINSFILSRSGGSAGVGFAIPSAQVSRVVASAVGGQTQVQRAWLGAKGNAVTGDIARSLGLTRPEGVLVSNVYRGSAADAAGLKAGDIILNVDGQPVNDESGLRYRISLVPLGQTVPLTVLRNNRPADLRIKAAAPPANPPRDERLLKGENPFSGAKVVNLSPAVADELGVDPFDAPKGVLVFSLEGTRTYAASVGLRPGDIIRAVNGVNIETTSQLDSVLKAGARGWRITIIRNGQQITAQFR